MKIKIEVCKSRSGAAQRYWARIRALNSRISFQTEMMKTRQSALKAARNMARYINENQVKAEVMDFAKTYSSYDMSNRSK